MKHLALTASFAALLLCSACSSEQTALQVRLVVDPELNTEADVLGVVRSVELLLDSPSGFAGVSSEGSLGRLEATNADTDAALELSLRRDVDSKLPLFRLLPGSNIDRGFKITARGLAGQQTAALGGLSAVRFAADETLDLLVPFNLRAAYRPPRVLVTLPSDGQSSVPSALNQVFVEFSKLVDHGSVPEHLRVVYQSTAGDRPVPGGWSMGLSSVVDSGIAEQRSTATLQIDCPLSPGTYRIEAGDGIVDLAGRGLDQNAADLQTAGFTARFVIAGSATSSPCAGPTPPDTGCTEPTDCDLQGTGMFTCLIPPEGKGVCVPAVEDCANVECPENYVCQPVDGPLPDCPPACDDQCIQQMLSQGIDEQEAYEKCCQPDVCDPNQPPPVPQPGFQCIQDCRSIGICGEGTYCDQGSGLCLPCDNNAGNPECYAPPPEPPPPPPPDCEQQCAQACANNQQQCAACYEQYNCPYPQP